MNLVTGATGIIGSHVVLDLLRKGRSVRACRRADSDMSKTERLFNLYNCGALFPLIQWVEVDINDVFALEDAMRGVTHVYHCAGLVSFLARDRKKLMAVNETGTANVVTACLSTGVSALCHVSSIATINNSDHNGNLHEGVFWKNSGDESDYAISKYNGERQVWRGIEEGLNAVIVNPGVVLSPGFRDQSSSRLFDTCYNGTRFYTEGVTAYVGAEDVARIMTELMDQRHFGERYILAEGNYSFRHILTAIHRGMERKAPRLRARKWMLRLAMPFDNLACFFTGRAARITPPLIDSALRVQRYPNTKIRHTLSYRFRPVDELIIDICRNYLAERSRRTSR